MTRCQADVIVTKRHALGLINRAPQVGVFVECRTGQSLCVRVTKTALRRSVRNLPNGSKITCEELFGQLVFGL